MVFHPFQIDASWYETYWYACPDAEAVEKPKGFPALRAVLRRLRALDWRVLPGVGRGENAAGHI